MVRETRTTLSLAGKKPGAARVPQLQELFFAEEPGSDMRPYDRLIGAALDGNRLQFAGQDAVGAAWRVVDPVLGDVVPVHLYARGSWGPRRPTPCCPTAGTGTTRPAERHPAEDVMDQTAPGHQPSGSSLGGDAARRQRSDSRRYGRLAALAWDQAQRGSVPTQEHLRGDAPYETRR